MVIYIQEASMHNYIYTESNFAVLPFCTDLSISLRYSQNASRKELK